MFLKNQNFGTKKSKFDKFFFTTIYNCNLFSNIVKNFYKEKKI